MYSLPNNSPEVLVQPSTKDENIDCSPLSVEINSHEVTLHQIISGSTVKCNVCMMHALFCVVLHCSELHCRRSSVLQRNATIVRAPDGY